VQHVGADRQADNQYDIAGDVNPGMRLLALQLDGKQAVKE
jgi:hypothetical protein